jgi:hypothetical protein
LLRADTGIDVIQQPYPHLIRSPAVPESLYAQLAVAFPDPSVILGRRDGAVNNAAARLPCAKVLRSAGIPQIWRDFFTYHTSANFWQDILRAFVPSFRQRFPTAETRMGKDFADWKIAPRGLDDTADAWLDCQFVINTAVTRVSSVKTVHVDKSNTMFSGLFYFRDPADASQGGDLGIFKWRREPRFLKHRMILAEDVEQVSSVKYGQNIFACFVNDSYAAHSVSPRSVTELPRRYINLIVETKFDVFGMPLVSPWVQVIHWRDVRRSGYRAIGGDRHY